MPKTCPVWDYFSKVDEIAKKAECNYCKNMFSYKSTTSNLKNHLKQKHVIVFEGMCRGETRSTADGGDGAGTSGNATVPSCGGGTSNITNTGAGIPSTNNVCFAPNPYPPIRLPKQQRLVSYLKKKLTLKEKEFLDSLLIKMIAYDCLPFSTVEDEGFRAFVRGLNPDYEIPIRKRVSTTLLDREYEIKLTAMKTLVNDNCLSICITVDCWTSKTMQPYMAITGHFINIITLEFKSILLQCSPLDGSHTGENIADAINLVVTEWGLTNKINFFVTDNALNMERAASLLSWPHFGCYAHKLNLVANSALAIPEVATTISKVQKTVAHFKRSSIAKEKLIKYQINSQGIAEGSALTLIMSVPTRWNSTYLMLERFLRLQEAIRATVPNLEAVLPIIPIEEWRCLEQYCTVLKPLYEATLIMSAENYLTASKATVIAQGLLDIYEMEKKRDYFAPVRSLIRTINTGLNRRLGALEKNMPIAVCTLLDPRFKTFGFQDQDVLLATKNFVIAQLCQDVLEEEPELRNSGNNSATTVDTLSLWNKLDRNVSSSQKPRSANAKRREELEMFLNQEVIWREACPLEWWRGHKMIYPNLYLLFIQKCNIIVTSVPCERAFSKAGQIISDRRTRLTTSKVTKLMFLHGNKNV